MRRNFPPKVKAEAFLLANGKCQDCGMFIKVGAVHYDHIIPDALGGEPIISNCQVLCIPCHRSKTRKQDVPAIAKTKRIRNREIGIRRQSTLRSRGFEHAPPQRSASRPIERH